MISPRPMWQSTQSTRAWGETRYVWYSGGMVWQVSPQKGTELEYSQAGGMASKTRTRNAPTPR